MFWAVSPKFQFAGPKIYTSPLRFFILNTKNRSWWVSKDMNFFKILKSYIYFKKLQQKEEIYLLNNSILLGSFCQQKIVFLNSEGNCRFVYTYHHHSSLSIFVLFCYLNSGQMAWNIEKCLYPKISHRIFQFSYVTF